MFKKKRPAMKRNKIKLRIVSLVTFICLMAMLLGCVTKKSDIPDPKAKEDQIGAEKFKESQRVFAIRNPMIVSNVGDLELTVRMATIAEIPEDLYKLSGLSIPIGAGSLGLGLVAPPMAAGSLVVGGVLIIPLGTYLYFHEKGIWDSINEALSNAELTRAIDRAMKDRLSVAFAEESAPNVKIEIIIQAFGIVNSSSMKPHCLVISADFILSRDNREVNRDHLRITEFNRSKDAPPPQCCSLEHFAKNEARLVKDTLTEYAEVLSVMAMDRFLRENSK
jgi:hypothetical protein